MSADPLPGGAWSIAVQCDDIRPLFLDTGYFSPGFSLLSTARGEHSWKNIIAYIMMAFLGSMLWSEWPSVWGFCLGGEEKQRPPTSWSLDMRERQEALKEMGPAGKPGCLTNPQNILLQFI